MSSNYVSTQYLATSMSLSVMQTQSELAKAQTESASGEYADLGLQLGSQSGYELSLKNENDLLQTFTATNGVASTNLSTTQSALDSLRSTAQTTLQSLTTWTSGDNSGATLQNLGQSNLQSLISTTNTTSGDQYVFGGINSGVPPMNDYFSSTSTPSAAQSAIDKAFTNAFGASPAASSISASSMQSFLNSSAFTSQFQGAAWASNWSAASSVNVTSAIAPGQTIATSTNANQPGFQELAQAYAMLNEFGDNSALSQAAKQTVATTASSLISQAVTSLTATEATVGSSQASVTDANNAISAQSTILQTQIDGLDQVNSYSIATQVSSLTTQIQTAYELTAQLQQLSLSKYLPIT